MNALLVAMALVLSACNAAPCDGGNCNKAGPAQAAPIVVPILPTETPPQELPTAPKKASAAPKAADLPPGLDQLMKSVMESAPKPKLVCNRHPCTQAYRLAARIDDDTAEAFGNFMEAAVEAKADFIMIELNTLGGSARSAHEISRLIEHAPARVVCVVDGDAVSAGMYILSSCDTRVMTKRSNLMIHQVSLMNPEESHVTATVARNQLEMMRVSTRAYLEWVIKRFKGVTFEQALARTDHDTEWWMDWQEALKFGAIDKVIDGPPEHLLSQLMKTGKI